MIIKKSDIEEIEMDLTGTCNLSCPLCTRNYQHANHLLAKNVRALSEITAQLDQYPNLKRFFIAGAVSEPTMYKDFTGFIEYLNGRSITYEIFTNGNTRTTAWWEKLGELVPSHCMCCFTICGSTQAIHETYRVGSDLQQIIDNATAFRMNGRRNDWVQHIQFEYNTADLAGNDMKQILSQFSNVMLVETEGVRRLNKYNKAVPIGVSPRPTRDKMIKVLFDRRPVPGDDVTIRCKSLDNKKVYINQYGKVSACYTHAEFEQDYFEGSEFDYTDILSFKYPDCFLCESKTRTLIEKTGMDFVC